MSAAVATGHGSRPTHRAVRFGQAWIGVIGAPGLGRSINQARAGGVPDLMYALTIATGLLGWGLNVVLSWVERRALHWHPSHREVAR